MYLRCASPKVGNFAVGPAEDLPNFYTHGGILIAMACWRVDHSELRASPVGRGHCLGAYSIAGEIRF